MTKEHGWAAELHGNIRSAEPNLFTITPGEATNWLADYQLVSQPAKANHARVPEIMRRSGCEATITSPPQIVAG